MGALLLDTHVIHWWSAEPHRVSATARHALREADEITAAAISWYELAWLARHERIVLNLPIRSWLRGLGENLRTIGVTPSIAATAAELPALFPGDPADRLIYATAVEHGFKLLTKDRAITQHDEPHSLVVW